MSKSPQIKFKKQNYKKENFVKTKGDKHTESNIYSITIRCGNGLNLGKKTVQDVVDWFRENSDHHILGVEKYGNEEHFQGGIFCASLKRQDNLRRSLNPLVIKIWEAQEVEEGRIPSSIKKEQVSKHALKITPHNDWAKLVQYCTKEGGTRIESRNLDSETEKTFKEYAYCAEHNNPLSVHQIMSCPKCQPLPMYHIKNIQNFELRPKTEIHLVNGVLKTYIFKK